MSEAIFHALDKVVEGGGSNLSKSAIVGRSKKDDNILSELCERGYLEKTGGRQPKYNLTSTGRSAWEELAPSGRVAEVTEKKRKEQEQLLFDFLSTIQSQQGKALNKTQRTTFSRITEEAQSKGLVQAGPKANTFTLLEQGEELLLSAQPLEIQVKELEKLYQETARQARVTQKHLEEELTGFREQSNQCLTEVSTSLEEHLQQSKSSFEKAIEELSSLAIFMEAAQIFQNDVDATVKATQQKLHSEVTTLTELGSELQELVEKQSEQLGTFERKMLNRTEELTRKLSVEETTAKQEYSEDDVWQVTTRVHAKEKEQASSLGGIVKVPDLTDGVLAELSRLSTDEFHLLLQKWEQQKKVLLQVCNVIDLESRATEGINSSRGLLFYVKIR